MCPHCGKGMNIPYVCDGTFRIIHNKSYKRVSSYMYDGCEQIFYVAILDGRLHVHSTKEDLNTILELLRNRD